MKIDDSQAAEQLLRKLENKKMRRREIEKKGAKKAKSFGDVLGEASVIRPIERHAFKRW